MTSPPRILIIYAHPTHHYSRINRRLYEAAKELPNVQIRNLYDVYPDFYIDVKHEQQLVEQCDLLVFQHPIHWYSMPALLKEWIDTVFEHGWAYGSHGTALRGKDFWLVASSGGPESALELDIGYEDTVSSFLPPIHHTALYCGLNWLQPMLLHGAHKVDSAMIESWAEQYRERLASYPAWAKTPSA
jgi:glutathione-regulated potassium-efflux system ancillary protein KefF